MHPSLEKGEGGVAKTSSWGITQDGTWRVESMRLTQRRSKDREEQKRRLGTTVEVGEPFLLRKGGKKSRSKQQNKRERKGKEIGERKDVHTSRPTVQEVGKSGMRREMGIKIKGGVCIKKLGTRKSWYPQEKEGDVFGGRPLSLFRKMERKGGLGDKEKKV